jgi:hypothetical protein
LAFVPVAAILVTTPSAILIGSAIRGAERVVVGDPPDTRRTLDAANAELALQYSYRVSSDSGWDLLPPSARDISLRAISQVTLRSYPGVEGGFYRGRKSSAIPTQRSRDRSGQIQRAPVSLERVQIG